MPLQRRWHPLDRPTVARAPDRPGVYELGDDGDVHEVGAGVVRDELKTALAYSDATQVRWETTQTIDGAVERAAEHRERL